MEYLSAKEMGCRDGTPYPAKWLPTRGRDLRIVFGRIRGIWGRPITVGSCYRTTAYNARVGGARASQHVDGRALDLYPPKGVSIGAFQREIRRMADQMAAEGNDLIGGIGYYPTFCHVDIRGAVGDRAIVWWGSRPAPEVAPKSKGISK